LLFEQRFLLFENVPCETKIKFIEILQNKVKSSRRKSILLLLFRTLRMKWSENNAK